MVSEFLQEYFISSGYNLVNTTVYAILFVISAYLIFLLLKKLRIKIDKKLAIAITPFVFFGSSVRVLVDRKIIETFLFVSPTIYIVVFSLTITSLLAAKFLEKKYKIAYPKTLFIIGLLFTLFPISAMKIVNFYGALLIALFLLPWVVILAIAKWSVENKLTSLIHIFDATTTFVSIQFFGYVEQHILPNIFINAFCPFSFVLVKAVTILLILVLIDKNCKDKQFKNYLKLVIGILGAATGIRDFLRILALA
jgi:uncharacterized membrane protein